MKRETIVNSLFWKFLERCGAQGVTILVSVLLARLLEPKVYGTVSLILVFISILDVFVDSGVGVALVQKQESDDTDFSSVFYFNIVSSTVLYLLMYFSAPHIASFYGNPDLVELIRVMSLVLLVSGVRNVLQAYVLKNFLFKKIFISTITSTVASGATGILLAYFGYGIWALVVQNLLSNLLGTLALWLAVKWRPTATFSWKRFSNLFSYGWKILISNLIQKLYEKLSQLIIGKMYSSSDLAYYNQGQQLPYAIVSNINTTIESVFFPTISLEQDNIAKMKAMARRTVKTGMFIMAPLMLGFAAVSDNIIELVLTDKWINSAFYLKLACLTFMFCPLETVNLNVIKALGRSDLILRMEIAKKILGLVILLISMRYGVKTIAVGLVLSSIIGQLFSAIPCKKLLNYSVLFQVKDIFPTVILASFMFFVVSVIARLSPFTNFVTIIVQIVVGATCYVGIAGLLRMDSFIFCTGIIRDYLRKFKLNSREEY